MGWYHFKSTQQESDRAEPDSDTSSGDRLQPLPQ